MVSSRKCVLKAILDVFCLPVVSPNNSLVSNSGASRLSIRVSRLFFIVSLALSRASTRLAPSVVATTSCSIAVREDTSFKFS